MEDLFGIKKIAEIKNGFSEKFGIPRQSGLCDKVLSRIVFEPEFRVREAFRGLEDFSHIWIIWQFSEAVRKDWSPTVRPPRLGGNKRIGVFATRSPFRPNPLGLSCVRLERIEYTDELGPVLVVSGADLMDGTPIYDLKPYIPYADIREDATEGFTGNVQRVYLDVELSDDFKAVLGNENTEAVRQILSEDPRPAYQNDPERIYKMSYNGFGVAFCVCDGKATVTDVSKEK